MLLTRLLYSTCIAISSDKVILYIFVQINFNCLSWLAVELSTKTETQISVFAFVNDVGLFNAGQGSNKNFLVACRRSTS